MKLLWLMSTSWAQDHGAETVAAHATEHGGAQHIPWDAIFVQTFNFTLLLALLAFLMRKAVKQHFADRASTYKEMVDRAENARKEAEHSRKQVEAKLAKLEQSAGQNVARASQEAEELRKRLIEEAKLLARKVEADAHRVAAVELEKAKMALRKELLEKALSTSQENLKKSLGSSDQKKLQNEFVQKIELVGG